MSRKIEKPASMGSEIRFLVTRRDRGNSARLSLETDLSPSMGASQEFDLSRAPKVRKAIKALAEAMKEEGSLVTWS
jgi:hypothetical protein